MRYLSQIAIVFSLFVILGVTNATYAKSLKGVVELKGELGPCEVTKKLGIGDSIECKGGDEKKKVVAIVGDVPRYEEGATVIVKIKGKRRSKAVGRIKCAGKGALSPQALEECTKKDEYIIWLDQEKKGYVIIETEKGLFDKGDEGDSALLKAKAKRAVVEGC